MTTAVERESVEAALAQRLGAVSPHLLAAGQAVGSGDSPTQPGDLLDALVAAVTDEPTPARVWLLITAVSGAFPTADDVRTATRFFRIAPRLEATMWVLDYAVPVASAQVADRSVQVVAGGVVVDVDHTARHDLHTGIQQVVRRVLPRWADRHEFVPVAWTEPAQSMRLLTAEEHDRVVRWGDAAKPGSGSPADDGTLVVPWRSVVVLPEVPFPDACDRLAALAQFSGNAVVAIGYDCIPLLSADMVPIYESNRFARYLTVVKHLRRIACIGATPMIEFSGFVSALPAQGLSGPEVVEVPLPVEAARREPEAKGGGPALVLGVGTFEPRKNHAAVLHACERLWRQGLRFELLLIGGSGWIDSVPETVRRLQKAGRAVRLVEKATAAELRGAYRRARFTVFASLHEGFGLPVAESFEQGTPVITTRFGSTGELARGGGALLVDPHDDEELVEAMRLLLTDDEVLGRLRREILDRPARSWTEYAAELWDCLVAPELEPHVPDGSARW